MTSESLARGFVGQVPRVPLTLRVRLGVVIVAFAILLLPLLYLALVALVGYGVYLHLVYDTTLLTDGRVGIFRLVAYFGPAIIGTVVVAFMFKPLLARPAKMIEGPAIARSELPLLFELVEHISRALRAPLPRDIRLDMDVNASARLRLFGRKDLTLTVGLPLLAGLDLVQLAGVLAHELGHFAQGSGLRMTFVIRKVGIWLARVAYERDAWDVSLARYAETAPWQLGFVLHMARLSVWLTRRVLAGLAHLGFLISSFMLRQMEFDADRYEARLVGGAVFASTALRMRVLLVARNQAMSLFNRERAEGRLLDDFAGLIAALADGLPAEVRAQVEAMKPEAGMFDTHPPDDLRIERARAESSEGVVQLEGAATALMTTESLTSRRVTMDFYRAEGLLPPMGSQPCTVAEVLQRHSRNESEAGAADRHLGPFFGLFAPLELATLDQPPGTLADALESIHEARALAERLRPPPTEATSAGENAPIDENSLDVARAAARERLLAALTLVQLPSVRAQLDDPAALEGEVNRLLSTLKALARSREATKLLAVEHDQVVALFHQAAAREEGPSLASLVTHKLAALHGMTQRLERQLSDTPYPFEHSKASLSIGIFVGHGLPIVDGYEIEVHARTSAVLRRLVMLYQRALDRLAVVAEQLENAAHSAVGRSPSP